jgi:shikimate kinase
VHLALETAAVQDIPLLVITGPVGAGKTAVVGALSDLLSEAGIAHAAIDQDWLRSCFPRPADDPFHMALGLRNLAAVWVNFRAAGAARLIVADVVETQAQRADYLAAAPGAQLTVVRLRAALPTLLTRLAGRETGASLVWHQARAAELEEIMTRNRVADLVVETDGKSVKEVAREVAIKTGWLA